MPVGLDQSQHLELATEIAEKINNRLRMKVFTVPKPEIQGTKLKSLRDPSKKMSKSTTDPGTCIFLTDDTDTVYKKIGRAVTDSIPGISYDDINRPGLANLIDLFALVRGCSRNRILDEYRSNTSFESFKGDLSREIDAFIRPLRESYIEHMSNPQRIRKVLEDGAARAQLLAKANLDHIKRTLSITKGAVDHVGIVVSSAPAAVE